MDLRIHLSEKRRKEKESREEERRASEPSSSAPVPSGTGRKAKVSVVTETGARFGKTVPEYREDGNVLWYDKADAGAVFSEMLGQLGRYTA